MEMVLSTIVLVENGKAAFMHVSEEMLIKSGATLQDVEGFIDFPRSLRSVQVAVLVKEASCGEIAVSMRAKGECDVASVARRFSGGGHRNAAGFRVRGKTIEEVRREIHQELTKLMPEPSE
jgi:phosphoesterase RecJ-like protein